MAQPIKIQNEPSMDEILASIRRIIEDSEALPGPATAVANDDAGIGPRAEPVTRKESAPKPAQAAPVRLSAGLAHELDRVAAPAASAPAAPAAPKPEAAEQRERPTLGESMGESLAPAAARASLEAINAASGGDRPEPARRMPVQPPVPAAASEPRAPILSDVAGRQVAAAFEELSEAYAQSRLRSFEEMAEEMLRPMLRDWLDNNLPGLVERLVREEIDRVARGVAR